MTKRGTPRPSSDALSRDAAAAFRAGDLAKAESLSRALLARDPNSGHALHELGLIECRRGRWAEGIAFLRRALRRDPENANAHFNLGVALIEIGEAEAAADSHRQAIARQPEYADAWSSLSAALSRAGQFDEAIAAARRAVELAPHMIGAAANLAVALRGRGDERAALQAILDCVQRNPESAEGWFNMAAALQANGEPAAAIQAYERVFALEPGHIVGHAQCALARLLLGDFARGWPEYEWRLRRPGQEMRAFPRPRWRGEDLAGRTILVHTEQGLGDAIQMLRYVEPLTAKAGHVVVQVNRAVLPLVPRLARVTTVVDGVAPPFDVESPSLSLPLCFGTTLENIPGGSAYLTPDAARVRAWEKVMEGAAPGRRIGLVWAGNPAFGNDRNRSVPFATLGPMLALPGVTWFSLQLKPLDEEARALGVIDLSDRLTDLGETAAAIACMDLVISVDTAVAHLAGALGKPVWILLPFVPDWRWLLEREDSPWYPSARLFRQTSQGDWRGVIARTADALEARLRSVIVGGRVVYEH